MARGSGALRFDSGGGWKALESETVGALPAPVFCYTGSLSLGLGRLLACRGREALLRGRGAMEWRLWGALRLARSEGGHLDQSALLRWLAEAACFPPALLPSRHLRWLPAQAGDPPHSARAVLTLGSATTTATLTFDGEGRVVELRSEDFWRVAPGGGVTRQPFHARSSRHRRFECAGTCCWGSNGRLCSRMHARLRAAAAVPAAAAALLLPTCGAGRPSPSHAAWAAAAGWRPPPC